MRLVLLIAALLCTIWAMVLGFGFVDDPDLVEDYAGWFALGAVFFIATFLPYERFDRRVE